MDKPVAVKGDTQATASLSTAPSTKPDWAGGWAAGTVTETSYSKLTVSGVEVIHEAECTFSFEGVNSAVSPTPPPVDMESTITLTASTTILQKGNSNVLVNGDSASDSHGNQLIINASGHLSTT
jgi:hypothetical protein